MADPRISTINSDGRGKSPVLRMSNSGIDRGRFVMKTIEQFKKAPTYVLAAAIAAALAMPVTASAGVFSSIFEMEGDAVDSPAGGAEDWSKVNTEYNKIPGIYSGNAKVRVFVPDYPGLPGVSFTSEQDDPAFGSGCKDNVDLTGCALTTGSIPAKDQITNGYAAFYSYAGPATNVQNPNGSTIPFNGGVLQHLPGDLIIAMGGDLHVENGSASWGGWFTRKSLEINTAGTGFVHGRTVGDILVVADFHEGQSGPSVTFSVVRWVGTGGNAGGGTLQELFSGTELRCSTATDNALGCAISNNGGPVTAPWPYLYKNDATFSPDFPATTFSEGILNLSAVLRMNQQELGCISDFMFETRSSGESYSAKLKDLLIGHVPLCSVDVEKTGIDLSKKGDLTPYTIDVTNTGVVKLYKQSINDTLMGELTTLGSCPGDMNVLAKGQSCVTSSNCDADLVPEESCTIQAMRRVGDADPDPLPNIVNVVYDSESALGGDEVTGSSNHSVNLFQPSITLGKVANPTLTKPGHDVAYTITLNNTSSADSPNLNCTVTDDMLGVNKTVTLASNAQDITNATYMVKSTDPDPLPNTANVSCTPVGYPNILTAAAGASVNLFQPSISFTKAGDTQLTKPGHAINYTLTLTNTSSSDTPAMTCRITDTKLGIDKTVTLASGAQDITSSAYTVQPGDLPGPVLNTANVSCSPAGFTNTYPGSGNWSVNLFNPSVQVTKACQDASSTDPTDKTVTVGNPLRYTFTLTNTSSGTVAPALVLDSLSDNVLGNLAALATAANPSCSSLASGGSCSFTKDYTPTVVNEAGLTNTVTAHYHPQGFTNDITHQASDTCYVMPALEGCTPGFWQGGAGSKLWDRANDPQWKGDGTNPYVHTTLFNGFFGQYNGTLVGVSMMDLVGTGGTSDSVRRAARDVVAAYLNASWGINIGYTTQQIKVMWTAAVSAGTNAAFDALHNTLSVANDPTPGDDCPL